jgi:hypothetical protein
MEASMNLRKTIATSTVLAVTLGGLALVRAKNAQALEIGCYKSSPSGESPGRSHCRCEGFEQCPSGPSFLRAEVQNTTRDGVFIVVAGNYGHETGLVRGYSYCTNAPVPTSWVKNYTPWISSSSHQLNSCGFTGYSRVGIGCEGVMSSCP